MKSLFNSVRFKSPPVNTFDLSREVKTTVTAGKLIPILHEPNLPGDSFSLKTEALIRLAPQIAPTMHRENMYIHSFFVPNRLLWNDWEDHITGGKDGTSVPSYPKIVINETRKANFVKGLLPDYFGIPTMDATINNILYLDALPFRAYHQIMNDYYINQNLEDPFEFLKTGGLLDATEQTKLVTPSYRNYEKDYFTGALPFTQRGGDVNLPIDSEFSPEYLDPALAETLTGPSGTENITRNASEEIITGGEDTVIRNLVDPQTIDTTSVTVNDLRTSVRLQEWLEKNARAGSRYVEQLYAHFKVKSSDARLQRAEYLGGQKIPIKMAEVLQTSRSQTTYTPQGTMAGHGIGVGSGKGFHKKYFEEFGQLIVMASILPRTAYQNGVHKKWQKFDKLDNYFPEFAHLGEQDIKNHEVYYDGTDSSLNDTFGYVPRYAEYKYGQSTVHGDFRDDLLFWHKGRVFTNPPSLNSDFVKANDVTERVFAVEDSGETDKYWIQLYHNFKGKRKMDIYGTPYL